ncbi:preprotein translocase subunit SecG [Patescibacteria group bacterium]|nr:preprotein translocase subunit SecG [Patescibacteria group bacterium]
MREVLLIVQIVVSVLLTGAILLQAQGSGLGTSWGGGGETYHTKRGVERVVFILTIVGVVVFAALSVANLVVRS